MSRMILILLTGVAALTLGTAATAAPATLQASPKQLKFGKQTVNTQTTLTFTLTNTSSDTVQFAGSVLQGYPVFNDDLSQEGPNTCVVFVSTLAPGASCTYPILFAPTAPGQYRGAIIFEFLVGGATTNSSLTIKLSGTGVSPA